MKKVFILVKFLTGLFLSTALAHPGVGIVEDSKGNIFYTDLTHVWKIGTDGKKTIAVKGVHTHELFIDANDELYGEHTWYNGERLNTWGYFAWCFRNDGSLDTVHGPKAGFREDYSFNRDAQGNQYWTERFTVSRIKKKTPGGDISILAEGKFKDIRWMYVTEDGIVFFVDLLDLYRIGKDGKLELLVKELAEKPGLISPDIARHSIMGIWVDQQQSVFAAVASERTVKKIDPHGRVTNVLFSQTPWSPCGGLVDKKGNLWIMEYSITNEIRVRKISEKDMKDPPSETRAVIVNQILPVSMGLGILALGGFGLKKLLKKKSSGVKA